MKIFSKNQLVGSDLKGVKMQNIWSNEDQKLTKADVSTQWWNQFIQWLVFKTIVHVNGGIKPNIERNLDYALGTVPRSRQIIEFITKQINTVDFSTFIQNSFENDELIFSNCHVFFSKLCVNFGNFRWCFKYLWHSSWENWIKNIKTKTLNMTINRSDGWSGDG